MKKILKFLHTSDWHLGKMLGNFSRLAEQEDFLNELVEISIKEDVDLILVAGDIYDTPNPSIRAQELFFQYCKKLSNNGKRAVCVIAGNHDSPERIEAPYPFSMETGVVLLGYPESVPLKFNLSTNLNVLQHDNGFIELKLPNVDFPVRIVLTPYANEKTLKMSYTEEEITVESILKEKWRNLVDKYCDTNGVNLLMTHLFVMKEGESTEEEPEEEKSVLTLGGANLIRTMFFPIDKIQYVALGHLHKYIHYKENNCSFVYPGSPIAYSVRENDQTKYVNLVQISPNEKPIIERKVIKSGKKIYRKHFDTIDDTIEWLKENQNCYVELTIKTDQYLKTEDHRKIRDTHTGIINIIPDIQKFSNEGTGGRNIDLQLGIKDLFKNYFESKKHIQPNENILKLFDEILSGEDR
jgi:DNA repair protein SbcD/Mre11